MTEPICQTLICEKQQLTCEQRFMYLEKIIGIKFDAIDKAMVLSSEEIKRRMHEANGIRQQMDKQNDNFVDLGYYRIEHDNLKKDIDELKEYKNVSIGKSATNNMLSAFAILISFIVAVLHFFPGMR